MDHKNELNLDCIYLGLLPTSILITKPSNTDLLTPSKTIDLTDGIDVIKFVFLFNELYYVISQTLYLYFIRHIGSSIP